MSLFHMSLKKPDLGVCHDVQIKFDEDFSFVSALGFWWSTFGLRLWKGAFIVWRSWEMMETIWTWKCGFHEVLGLSKYFGALSTHVNPVWNAPVSPDVIDSRSGATGAWHVHFGTSATFFSHSSNENGSRFTPEHERNWDRRPVLAFKTLNYPPCPFIEVLFVLLLLSWINQHLNHLGWIEKNNQKRINTCLEGCTFTITERLPLWLHSGRPLYSQAAMFVEGYVPPGEDDAKKLKEYNMKIARRFLLSSVLGEAETLARSPDHDGEPKKIWKALCDKYDGKEIISIQAKMLEWHSLSIGRNKKAIEFTTRVRALADDLVRLGKRKDADDRLFALRSGLRKYSRSSAESWDGTGPRFDQNIQLISKKDIIRTFQSRNTAYHPW